MRVIITGGTGLIGNALSASLAKDGHEVIVLTRSPEKTAGKLAEGVKAVAWDGSTASGWGALAEGAGAIVNLAGSGISSGRWTQTKKREIILSRENAGKAVTQAVEQAVSRPKVVVQASAVGYYGPHRDEKITEKMPAGRDFLAGVCITWEKSTAGVEAADVRRVIIRTGVVLSTKGGALPPLARPYRLYFGGPVGSGDQWLPWIHIADEVAAIRFLIDHPLAAGPFNLSAPNPLTNRGFGKVLAAVLKRPASIPVPAFMLKLIFGEMAVILLEGQRQIPNRLLDLGFVFHFPRAESALQELYA